MEIVDLTKEESTNKCILLGTLYKHQELKPSILKEIADELQAIPQPPRLNYCSPKDALFLEDDVARVKLVGNIAADSLVTGLICSVIGTNMQDGSFWVEELCFPGPYLIPLFETPCSSAKDHGQLLLFLSGLDFANQAECMALHLLNEWVTGMLGNHFIQEEAANIVRIIIAGIFSNKIIHSEIFLIITFSNIALQETVLGDLQKHSVEKVTLKTKIEITNLLRKSK